jgi:aminobenzoyl-glutamate transport protein
MPAVKRSAREPTARPPRGAGSGVLDRIERAGNRLPDPAFLFLLALVMTWIASAILAPVEFTDIDPRTLVQQAGGGAPAPIRVKNQLSGAALAVFLSRMVKNFTEFPPLGVVLVALLGVGVAEHTGLVGAGLRGLLGVTPARLLTPVVLLVSIVSHAGGDTGYVVVIPLAGAIYAAAGRHPLVGITAAFAGVAGGFGAGILPSTLDPLLQGFTQSAAQILDPARTVNPLCNWAFTSVSSLLIILAGWWITERVVEPRLIGTAVDGEPSDVPRMDPLSGPERRGLLAGLVAMAAGLCVLGGAAWPGGSPLRSPAGDLTAAGAPLMEAIVPLIFLLFLAPGTVYGYVAGTVSSHRDIVAGMSRSMNTMGYYLVMAFFAAQFTYAFRESNIGALIAIKGAVLLKGAQVPAAVTITGIIVLSALIDLLVGSASAKWAVLAPIFVPMLMQTGIAPELTQAAYRIGDSVMNIETPLMPYFPLVVVYCQRYVRNTGIGTLMSLMLPYSLSFLLGWWLLLLVYWALGVPLGLQASYTYP